MAIQKVPDLVLSDIMMPVTNGMKLLRRIENDILTRHISMVILTTRSDISPLLSRIEKNADAYFVLTFDEIGLESVKENIIRYGHNLQEHDVFTTIDEIKGQTVKSIHDQFIQKIIHLMDSNLDNDQYGIADLCHALGMSRAQIYRKFKALIDRTPHDYLRTYRLQKAKLLLLSAKLNVSEVAYRTGFKNVSHFSRIFSKTFGKNPREFIR
jgi:AraC-like DNA-binding protein